MIEGQDFDGRRPSSWQATTDALSVALSRTDMFGCPRCLRLSEDNTLVTHINLDFQGWHVQRRQKQGTNRCYVYIHPAKE